MHKGKHFTTLPSLSSREIKRKRSSNSGDSPHQEGGTISMDSDDLLSEEIKGKENTSKRLVKKWQEEKEAFAKTIKELEEQKETDAVKIEEFRKMLGILQKDPDKIKRECTEMSRKLTVLKVNESKMKRRYTVLQEQEHHLRKEIAKLRDENNRIQKSTLQRMGHLQRYKEMASCKISELQSALDDSVPSADLERAEKLCEDLALKYRNSVQKQDFYSQQKTKLGVLENENQFLRIQITASNKELEATKRKLHKMETALNNPRAVGNKSHMNNENRALAKSEKESTAKLITALEMKELNQRTRAEHAQKMYEQMKISQRQMDERNLELESKITELTKINDEARWVERQLRAELADGISQSATDAYQTRIAELEATNALLHIKVSELQEESDVAMRQASTLQAQQKSNDKEVEELKKQILDYQSQSDKKAIIAKLYHHIVALQRSETDALEKLKAVTYHNLRLEAEKLRAEQRLDTKEQAMFLIRQQSTNRARHLRQTVQSLRTQFAGALPLQQQEKLSEAMLKLQEDQAQAQMEKRKAEEESTGARGRVEELELRIQGLEELLSALKNGKGAQKLTEWHKKMEDARLQELRNGRRLMTQMEEMRRLKGLVEEQELTIHSLQEDIVLHKRTQEEYQLAWDQQEVELEKHQCQIADCTGCQHLNEKLKEKEEALLEAQQTIVSWDKDANELKLRFPDTQTALELANRTIQHLRGRLQKNADEFKRYQTELIQARQEHLQEKTALQEKLDEASRDNFKLKMKDRAAQIEDLPSEKEDQRNQVIQLSDQVESPHTELEAAKALGEHSW